MIQHLTKAIQHIGAAMEGFSQGTTFGKFLIGLGSAIIGFFSPIIYLILICFATTIADMIYGIKVAIKKNKKVESGKTWKGTLGKIKAELVLLAIAHGLEWSVLDQSGVFVLTGGITVIITLTELWSILENLNTLDPKGPWKFHWRRNKAHDPEVYVVCGSRRHRCHPCVRRFDTPFSRNLPGTYFRLCRPVCSHCPDHLCCRFPFRPLANFEGRPDQSGH